MSSLGRAQTVTIANGATVSNGIDVMDAQVEGVFLPAAFTGVALTFQGSVDNVTYNAITKPDGTAYTLVVAPAKYVMVPPNDLAGTRYLKVISGTAEAAARDIILMLRQIA